MDQATRPEGRLSDVQQGWEVYSADEQKVGSVDRVEGSYILAHKGIFFPQDLYIPVAAIRRIEHDRVYLNIAKEAVAGQGWDMEPMATPSATSSAETTGWGAPATASSTPEHVTAPTGAREEGQTIHLHEEQLRANTERRPVGEVRLGKEVVEEQKTLTVPVTREEVVIERRPGDRQPDNHDIAASAGETLRVPVSEERVNVEKQTVMTEEVRVGTREVTEQQQVTDTVKREEARIENTGDVRVEGEERTPRPNQGQPRGGNARR